MGTEDGALDVLGEWRAGPRGEVLGPGIKVGSGQMVAWWAVQAGGKSGC